MVYLGFDVLCTLHEKFDSPFATFAKLKGWKAFGISLQF